MEYMLLKIDKVDGESTLKGFEKFIEVTSYSHEVSNPVQIGASNTGRTTGRPRLGELVITKLMDAASPDLNFYCCQAKDLGSVTLTLVRQDAEAKENLKYMEYKMEKTLLSSVSIGGIGGDDVPTETVTFNYTKLTWTYIPQKKEVGSAGNIPKWWDQETNTGG